MNRESGIRMEGIGALRSIADEELELMRSWRNAPSVRENMYTRHSISVEEHLAWWDRTRRREDQHYFMYELSGAPWGIVAFTGIDRTNSNAAWAFYAAPSAVRGTGTRMELLALDYAFSRLGLHKLYCEVLAFNTSVIKLHQKFGFQVEGIFRQQHKRDDAFVDIYRLGLLAEEWASKRDEIVTRVAAVTGGRDGQ